MIEEEKILEGKIISIKLNTNNIYSWSAMVKQNKTSKDCVLDVGIRDSFSPLRAKKLKWVYLVKQVHKG